MSARNRAPPITTLRFSHRWLPQPNVFQPSVSRCLPGVSRPALQEEMREAHHCWSGPKQLPPHAMIIEEQLAAQSIEALLVDNQRLVASNASLIQELEVTQQQHAEKGLQLRGKSIRMENELRAVRFELLQAHKNIKDLTTQIHMMTQNASRVTSTNKTKIEGLKAELERVRADIEHEKKRIAESSLHGEEMENKAITMAQEIEELQAELANAKNRANVAVTVGNSRDAGLAENHTEARASNSKKKRRRKMASHLSPPDMKETEMSKDASTKKKLLVLDVNGLLAKIVKVQGRGYVVKRPFCGDFLKFCFENFEVGVWSSRLKKNLDRAVDELFGDLKDKLLFCWDSSHCTHSRYKTRENPKKPLVFKYLSKIWENDDPNLPWKKGDYGKSNTLLLDDSPYKALLNPPHTAVFPKSYNDYMDENDNYLGSGGDIRLYLEGLLKSEDVQEYVEQHQFGQNPIDQWTFYEEVKKEMDNRLRLNSQELVN